MDVLHSFINDKKMKSKITSKTNFSHMYKTSDKVGGTIHSKLPKMTMPKYVMPKISYNTPTYKHHPTARNFQNIHFSSLIRRDKHSRNETSSTPGPAHTTSAQTTGASVLNTIGKTFSNIIHTAKGPADPNVSLGPVREEKGMYGTRFKELKVEELTDTQAKMLLPSVSAQLATGLTPDVVTLKQLEPYMKVGAVQLKPTDITASGISVSRITKGTGFTGPGDPTYSSGPIHDTGISGGGNFNPYTGQSSSINSGYTIQQQAALNAFGQALGRAGYTGSEQAKIVKDIQTGKSTSLTPEAIAAIDAKWIQKYTSGVKMTPEELAYQDTYLAHQDALKKDFGVSNVGLFDMSVAGMNARGGAVTVSTGGSGGSGGGNRSGGGNTTGGNRSGGGNTGATGGGNTTGGNRSGGGNTTGGGATGGGATGGGATGGGATGGATGGGGGGGRAGGTTGGGLGGAISSGYASGSSGAKTIVGGVIKGIGGAASSAFKFITGR